MSSDEYISKLSAKLMQGWCMLDTSCESCNIPLMRNRQKQDYCVKCEKFIGLQEVPSPPAQPAPVVQPTVSVAVSPPAPSHSACSAGVRELINEFQLSTSRRLIESSDPAEQKQILEVLLLSKQFLS
mmetsp:Transcript_6628/g.11695  ORF Transcript_6628/g.11695 Transcript_6628/m.11695 type:complete len:127 (+) Transcript_6628:1331-1711(+)